MPRIPLLRLSAFLLSGWTGIAAAGALLGPAPVTVTNTPSVKVTNVPTVDVRSLPPVYLGPDASVRTDLTRLRERFATGCVWVGPYDGDGCRITVPGAPGKIAVIETISFIAGAGPGESGLGALIEMLAAPGQSFMLWQPLQPMAHPDSIFPLHAWSGSPLLVAHPASATTHAQLRGRSMRPGNASGDATTRMDITGYLVDPPPP